MDTSVTPWWKALTIRKEIITASGQIDDVQMSLFQAVYGTGQGMPLYADAEYYGEITHPAERLTDLLAEISIRIGGGADYLKARAVTRLDQGMGGGKSHACIGAYHLAAHPESLFTTDLGKAVVTRARAKIGRDLPPDLNNPHVVVLPCDNMTPGAPVDELDGPAKTLYERFLWRLFAGKDQYPLWDEYRKYWNDKSKIAEAIRAIDRPLLIIVDELLDYVGNGLTGANNPKLIAQDMAFLRAILDVINDIPQVAMLVVLIASDKDRTALSGADLPRGDDLSAVSRRDDLNSLLERNGSPATVTEVGDFADILRRRLFETEPTTALLSATAALYQPVLQDRVWLKNVWEPIGAGWRDRWDDEVAACYPFHPMLMATAKQEWSKVTGFQRVRSTIRIFAATVYALQERGKRGDWVPALIGPGDLPLSNSAVREALLGSGLVEDERTTANYRSLAEIEVVGENGTSGTARRQDLERGEQGWSEVNPFAAERGATFIFIASIVGTLRPGRGRGASAPEVKAATAVPDPNYTITDADTVVEGLVHPDRGMSAVEIIPGQGNNKPARYYLSTRLTHRMLVNNIRRTITEYERDELIADVARQLMDDGPLKVAFLPKQFVRGGERRSLIEVLASEGIDKAYSNRLFVLDPALFGLRDNQERETFSALASAMGLEKDAYQVPVAWASSAVFAVVNGRHRANARGIAVECLARQKALAAPEIQQDAELKATGAKEVKSAKEQLEKAVRRAFQHIVYLAQPDPDGDRFMDTITFDDEHQSALNGGMVWKALKERDKVFDEGEFSAQVLVHNLRDSDYGKTLSDLRGSFYSAPRLPLLYGGDIDLQRAIYDAVSERLLDIVDGSGASVAVTAPNQVNLTSAGLRLAKPVQTHCPDCGADPHPGTCGSGMAGPAGGQDKGAATPGTATCPKCGEPSHGGECGTGNAPAERQVTFSFTRNLLAGPGAADDLASLLRYLYVALDEQEISFMNSTMQMVMSASAADKLMNHLKQAGISATTRDI